MNAITVRVRDLYSSLSQQEQRIADYFLSNPQDVFNKPIAELATDVGVNTVAWVRFAKKLGFNGLRDLKKALVVEISQTGGEVQDDATVKFADIKGATDPVEIMRAVRESTTQAIHNTLDIADTQTLEDVAKLVMGAKTIHLFGYGASALVASDLQSKLLRIGVSANFSADLHVQLVYAASSGPQDVAVLISNSGNTAEIVEILALLQSKGCPTVAITKLGKSTLAYKADYRLYTSAPEVYIRSGAMSSRIAQLTLVDVLFSVIASQNYSRIEQSLEETHKSCSAHKLGGSGTR